MSSSKKPMRGWLASAMAWLRCAAAPATAAACQSARQPRAATAAPNCSMTRRLSPPDDASTTISSAGSTLCSPSEASIFCSTGARSRVGTMAEIGALRATCSSAMRRNTAGQGAPGGGDALRRMETGKQIGQPIGQRARRAGARLEGRIGGRDLPGELGGQALVALVPGPARQFVTGVVNRLAARPWQRRLRAQELLQAADDRLPLADDLQAIAEGEPRRMHELAIDRDGAIAEGKARARHQQPQIQLMLLAANLPDAPPIHPFKRGLAPERPAG